MNLPLGILVGSDETQAWLLPWWWSCFRSYSSLPVSFANFGLSQESRDWCAKLGTVIDFPSPSPAQEKQSISKKLQKNWEKRFGAAIWDYRNAWFQKPWACLYSPYAVTLWLDLDCEVLSSLEPLFDQLGSLDLLLCRDCYSKHPDHPVYNSGVLLFRQSNPILQTWAEQSIQKSSLFPGDQDLLSSILPAFSGKYGELDPIYNWHAGREEGETKPVIRHWLGGVGKGILRQHLVLGQELPWLQNS